MLWVFCFCFFFAALGAVMWQRIQICCALFALYSAAPPAHINRLALFPDKSAWCEAKNITQIVGHTGCQPRSIQNRSGWRPSLSVCLSLCHTVCQCRGEQGITPNCWDVKNLILVMPHAVCSTHLGWHIKSIMVLDFKDLWEFCTFWSIYWRHTLRFLCYCKPWF